MFNLGITEILFLAILALLVIGPKQLPDVARYIGRFINELKRSADAVKQEFYTNTSGIKEEFDKESRHLQEISQKIDVELEKIHQAHINPKNYIDEQSIGHHSNTDHQHSDESTEVHLPPGNQTVKPKDKPEKS